MKRTPVVPKPKTVQGRVHINEERCKGCGFCIEFCPKSVLAFSPKFNSKGYHPPYAARPEECINCNLCRLVCPEFAIFSTPMNENTTMGRATYGSPLQATNTGRVGFETRPY